MHPSDLVRHKSLSLPASDTPEHDLNTYSCLISHSFNIQLSQSRSPDIQVKKKQKTNTFLCRGDTLGNSCDKGKYLQPSCQPCTLNQAFNEGCKHSAFAVINSELKKS